MVSSGSDRGIRRPIGANCQHSRQTWGNPPSRTASGYAVAVMLPYSLLPSGGRGLAGTGEADRTP
eukprot:3940128-Rhodomonas_salina.1